MYCINLGAYIGGIYIVVNVKVGANPKYNTTGNFNYDM